MTEDIEVVVRLAPEGAQARERAVLTVNTVSERTVVQPWA